MSDALPPVVIQAGGKGERMRAGGLLTPKVLVKVQGQALLERLLRQIAAEGAGLFYIITGFEAEQVESHVLGMADFTGASRLRFLRETTVRGNVGTLSELSDIGSPILFAFGDLFTNLSFRALYEVHRRRHAAITAASHLERHRLTLGHLIAQNERVIDYREKPEYQFLICSGIMAIEPEALQLLPKEGAVGMSRLVTLAIESGLSVTHWDHGADWIDVNNPEQLELANQARWPERPHVGP